MTDGQQCTGEYNVVFSVLTAAIHGRSMPTIEHVRM